VNPGLLRVAPAAVLCGFLLCGCAGSARPLRIETAGELPDEPRRAPGVAVDPAPELPAAAWSASAEQGLVVLKAPVPTDAAREVVREFFRAAVDESPERIEQLIADPAFVQSGAQASRQSLRTFWRARLVRLDYGSLAGQLVYRENDLEIYRAEDAARLSGVRALPFNVSGEDVLVRVPVILPKVGRTKLFGDEILFLLRPQADSYKIKEVVEDFQLP
jgi:hypothetical protein